MQKTAPWGKTAEGKRHHLVHHCADVAACFEALGEIDPVRNRLETAAGHPLDGADMARLAALSFLHDCGKLHPGFQAKDWPDNQWRGAKHGHVGEGWALLASEPGQVFPLTTLMEWGEGDAIPNLLRASIGHHGRPFVNSSEAARDWERPCPNGYDVCASAKEFSVLLSEWFPAAFAAVRSPLPDRPALHHLFRGLVTLADWIGSNRKIFPFVPRLQKNYASEKARPQARQALAAIGLDTRVWRTHMTDTADFSSIVPGWAPRPMQQTVAGNLNDNQLLILEAETGSGKTEAALWHFARLFAAGRVDSLYFAVPTRAAARQLHQRVNETLQHLFGESAPEAVLAVPGYLKVGETEGHSLPDFRVWWEDQPNEKELLARWAGESSKRYLAATVSVGTVDQVMLATLQVKHAHLRAAALSRSLLVIDEVHASDTYMTEIQTQLLEMHLGWGGYALLMSATLGASARSRWLGRAETPVFAEAATAPYPALWLKGAESPRTPETASGRHKAIHMRRATNWEAKTAARLAIDAAEQGARVLVIRNTVQSALDTFRAVQLLEGEPYLLHLAGKPVLHHSRFAAEDRTRLDMAVEKALSPERRAVSTEKGCLVIGTQTLEQSLDIDADFLVTDLAPVDVLLQRLGRLHRHEQKYRPPAFCKPQCVVLAPADGLDHLAVPSFENGLGGWEDRESRSITGIYTNLPSCALTLELVVAHSRWNIPAMNRQLVEAATHPEKIAAFVEKKGAVWQKYWNSIYGAHLAESVTAKHVLLKVGEPLLQPDGDEEPFPPGEEAIRTRLGAEGAPIPLPDNTIGPFGNPVSTLTLPAHWSKGIDPESARTEATEDGLRLQLGKLRLVYNNEGLQKETVR